MFNSSGFMLDEKLDCVIDKDRVMKCDISVNVGDY